MAKLSKVYIKLVLYFVIKTSKGGVLIVDTHCVKIVLFKLSSVFFYRKIG